MAGEAAPRRSGTHADGLDPVAAATSRSYVVRAPFTGVVESVVYTPLAAMTGAATNNRQLTLRQRGQAGALGATVATLNFVAGVTAPAFVARTIPLDANPANAVVTEGDVLEFGSFAIGTGIADPGGTLTVTFSRVTP